MTVNGFDSPQLLGIMLVLLTDHPWQISAAPSGHSVVAIRLDNEITLYFEIA